MLRLTIAFLMVGLTAAQAAEGWITQVEDDIFSGGKTATMLGISGGGDGVHISCDGDRELAFSIISKSEESVDGVPGELIAKIDGGETRRFSAESYTHNDAYVGFRSTDQEAIKVLVSEIGQAKKSALFGLQVPAADFKASMSPGVRGSTRAAADFSKACID